MEDFAPWDTRMIGYGLILMLGIFLILDYWRNARRLGKSLARKTLWRSLLLVFALYVGALSVLLWFENQLIYYPQSAAEFWQPPANLEKTDVPFKSALGDQLHGWWCPQHGATWTVLLSHGNAGNLSGHAWLIPILRKSVTANVFIYDYPGYGKSQGKPSEAGCAAAADAAYDWLVNTQNIPTEQLVLMGQSLGCALTCHLADKPHRAMVLLSPFTTLRALGQELFPIFPVKWLMRHHYDNVSKLKNYQKPLLIAHGDADEVIPFRQGKKLFDAVASKEKVFYQIDKGTHNDLDEGFFQKMGEFLASLAAKP